VLQNIKILSTEANTSIVPNKVPVAEVGTVCPRNRLVFPKTEIDGLLSKRTEKEEPIFVSIVIIEEPDPQLYEFSLS
jgi:hypothetical protein